MIHAKPKVRKESFLASTPTSTCNEDVTFFRPDLSVIPKKDGGPDLNLNSQKSVATSEEENLPKVRASRKQRAMKLQVMDNKLSPKK